MQASSAFTSAGAASPDEFYDAYSIDVEAESHWARARRRFFQHRLAVVSLFILIALALAALFAHRLAPNTYQEVSLDALNSPPSWSHPFGTDQIGRDYFSRTLYGLRTEMEIAVLIGLVATLIGTFLGAIAGFYAGAIDNLVMRLADMLLTFPPLVIVLVAATYFHADTLLEVSLLFGALLWMPIARIVRGSTLGLREREYVEAARAIGASNGRIITRHVLPNAVGSIAVAASVMTAGAVVLETTLSYLGVGLGVRYYGGRTDTTLPSLGDVMAAAANEGLFNWWGIVFPGLVVILIVAPIYFVGDGIRDALDPTPRRYVRPRRRRRRTRVGRSLLRALEALPRPSLPRVSLPTIRIPSLQFRGRLLVEAVAVLGLTAAVAAGIYAWKVKAAESAWAQAGTDVQNVSRAPGAQTEIALASGGSSGVFLGVSNDTALRTVRVYTSTNAGRTWASAPGPSLGLDACARGEPAAAVGSNGRHYVAFIVSGSCTDQDPYPYLVVASRAGPSARWATRRIATAPFPDSWDDKPALVTRGNAAYVFWSRLQSWRHETILVSSTRDSGRTWSAPRVVSQRLSYPRLVSATAAGDSLYVSGIDARFGVWLARSRDGRTFRVVRAGRLPGNPARTCARAGAHPTPHSATRCLGPNPSVAANDDNVVVAYGVGGPGELQRVEVSVFDTRLRLVWHGAPAGSGADGDRFWPAAAADPATGRFWVCFYDTTGDSSRERAWYTCTTSSYGTEWSTPLRAAEDSSRAEVLWEDARIYRFGDEIGYGGYTAVTAASGSAQPMWVDTQNRGGNAQEIFTARLDAPGYGR